MRIISGIAGGIRLQTPKSLARPTTDRVREALFSILGDRVPDARVLDLYAGSGAFGLEALSRGAELAVLVDQDREAVRTMETNLAKTGLDHARIVKQDVARFLQQSSQYQQAPFHIIFADPPYAKGPDAFDYFGFLLESSHLPPLLDEESGCLIVEVAHPTPEPDVPDWEPIDYRSYGSTGIWLLRKRGKESG